MKFILSFRVGFPKVFQLNTQVKSIKSCVFLHSSVYTTISDGKGGKIRVKKEKPGKGKKGKKGKEIPDFSDASTDSEAVDLSNMTEEEKKKYFEEKAKRKAEREKRRREKYGDKYDEMMAAHEKFVPGLWDFPEPFH